MADEGSSSSSNPTSPPLGWEDGHVVPEELKVLSEPLKVKTGSAHSFSTSFDNLRSPWLRRVSMSALSLVQIGRDARSISFHGSPHRDGLVPRRSVSEAALHALEGRVSAAKYKAHEFGSCPRTLCEKQTVLPTGVSDTASLRCASRAQPHVPFRTSGARPAARSALRSWRACAAARIQ